MPQTRFHSARRREAQRSNSRSQSESAGLGGKVKWSPTCSASPSNRHSAPSSARGFHSGVIPAIVSSGLAIPPYKFKPVRCKPSG